MMQTSKICRSDLDPPFCCQPPVSAEAWEAAGRRLAAARAAAEASRPRACLACGDPYPFPTFLARDEFECSNRDCCAVWTVER